MRFVLLALGLILSSSLFGQSDVKPAEIHMVYMGGNDCPPCVAWRQFELPALKNSEIFRTIKFSYVNKTVRSPVPPRFFLPEEVKPYKDALDLASGGRHGSAQVAILVNGKVFDYYWGYRDAKAVEAMITSIQSGTKYPFESCTKHKTGWVSDCLSKVAH